MRMCVFYEVLPETVVNYNFFLINKPLWSHWPAPVGGTVRDQTVWVVSTHILCSACNETDCLEWNPISVSVWPDPPRHALRALQRKWMYHQSIDFYSVWSSFCLLILNLLSEPSARCGMKLAWASHQTGCDCVTWYGQVWNKFRVLFVWVCRDLSAQRYQSRHAIIIGFRFPHCPEHVEGC